MYTPTGMPGGRPPHWWFDDESSLFGLFSFNWTLLLLGKNAPNGKHLIDSALRRGVDLEVVHITETRIKQLYGAPLILIRPDQIIGWRGSEPFDPEAVWNLLLGT